MTTTDTAAGTPDPPCEPPVKRPRMWTDECNDVALSGISGSTNSPREKRREEGEEEIQDCASAIPAASLCELVSVKPADAEAKAAEAEAFSRLLRGEYLVDMSKVSIEESVGSGTFGKVYRARYRGATVAVKLFNNKELMRRLVQEIYVLARLRHPNIVEFIGVGWKRESDEDEWEPAMFMEYCSMGSLFQVMHSSQEVRSYTAENPITELLSRNTRKIALGIAKALACIHSHGYSHLDICSSNILLTNTMEPKLADLGQARGMFGIGAPNVGHMQYRAPELCITKSKNYSMLGHYCEKADIYSYAILLWEIFHKEIPWSGADNILKNVRDGKRPKINKEIVQKPWQELLEKCWDGQPAKRITANEVVAEIENMELEEEVVEGTSKEVNTETVKEN